MWNVTPLYIMYNAVQQTYLGSKQNTYQWIAECHEMQTRRVNILCAALPHIKICRHSLSKIRATTMQHVVTHAAHAGILPAVTYLQQSIKLLAFCMCFHQCLILVISLQSLIQIRQVHAACVPMFPTCSLVLRHKVYFLTRHHDW